MRPTLTELLDGIAGILECEISPQIQSEHGQETMRGLVSNIRMASRASPKLAAFLAWDNEMTSALIKKRFEHAALSKRRQVDETIEAARNPSSGHIDADRHNVMLRGLLAESLTDGSLPGTDVFDHLLERAKRFPLRMSSVGPKPQKEPGRC